MFNQLTAALPPWPDFYDPVRIPPLPRGHGCWLPARPPSTSRERAAHLRWLGSPRRRAAACRTASCPRRQRAGLHDVTVSESSRRTNDHRRPTRRVDGSRHRDRAQAVHDGPAAAGVKYAMVRRATHGQGQAQMFTMPQRCGCSRCRRTSSNWEYGVAVHRRLVERAAPRLQRGAGRASTLGPSARQQCLGAGAAPRDRDACHPCSSGAKVVEGEFDWAPATTRRGEPSARWPTYVPTARRSGRVPGPHRSPSRRSPLALGPRAGHSHRACGVHRAVGSGAACSTRPRWRPRWCPRRRSVRSR